MGLSVLCDVQKELEDLKIELVDRIHKLFIEKYNGNKSQFAIACKCDEKAIRKIFNGEQGLTVNLLFKICFALQISPSQLFDGIEINGDEV